MQNILILLDDIILAAEAEDPFIERESLANKNGGDRYVVHHLKTLREAILELPKRPW